MNTSTWWKIDTTGLSHGFGNLALTAADLARLLTLLTEDGCSPSGSRVLASSWVAQMVSPATDLVASQGLLTFLRFRDGRVVGCSRDGDLGQWYGVDIPTGKVVVRLIRWNSPHTDDPSSTWRNFLTDVFDDPTTP